MAAQLYVQTTSIITTLLVEGNMEYIIKIKKIYFIILEGHSMIHVSNLGSPETSIKVLHHSLSYARRL